MKIGHFDTDKDALIIAEIGNNHEGSYALAEDLIGMAFEVGVDAVKFQVIIPEKLVSSNEKQRIQQLRRFQLSYSEYERLASYAKKKGLIFIGTPFDIGSAEFLNTIAPGFKIASSDNNFYPLLDAVLQTGKPVLLSTGLMDYTELNSLVQYIEVYWGRHNIKGDLAILHCVSNYPVAPKNANLLSIKYLADKFHYTIGYSDHTLGIDASILSVVLGARIIEKHFTLNKNYSDFRDHQFSADPKEMKELVEKVRNIKVFCGKYEKIMLAAEAEIKPKIRRSIAAKKELSAGHTIQPDDITWVRPGTGIPVGSEDHIIGKKVKKTVHEGELIKNDNLEIEK